MITSGVPKSSVLTDRSDRSFPVSRTHSLGERIELFAFCFFLGMLCLFAFIEGRPGESAKSLLALLFCSFGLLRVIGSLLKDNFRLSILPIIAALTGIVLVAILQIVPITYLSYFHSEDPFDTKSFIVFFSALIIAAESLSYLVTGPRRLHYLVGIVIAIGACSAAYGIFRAYAAPPSEQYAQFINRNHFALLAEMSTALLVGALTGGHLSKAVRFVGCLLVGVIVYSLLTAGSRGGVLSLLAMVLFSLLLYPFVAGRDTNSLSLGARRSWNRSRKIFGVAAACILATLVSLAAIALIGGDKVVSRLELVRDEVESRSAQRMNRGTIWSITLDLIKERPITGAGFGAYADAITRYDRSNGSWELEQAHNEYLEILANSGIVGLTLFGTVAFLVSKRALRILRSEHRAIRSACFGAVVGIFGVLIHSLVDFGLHVPINAAILLVLVLIATYSPQSKTDVASRKELGFVILGASRWLAPLAYVLVIIAVGLYAGRQSLAEYLAISASTSASIAEAQLATRVFGADPNAQRVLGLLLLDRGEYDQALLALERAARERPGSYGAWQLLGSARYTSGDLYGAEDSFLRSIELAPSYSQPKFMYGLILLQGGREREGFNALSEAAENDFSLYPQVVELAARRHPDDAIEIERSARPATTEARTYLARYFISRSLMTDKSLAFLLSDELPGLNKYEIINDLIVRQDYSLAHTLWTATIAANGEPNNELIFDGGFEHTKGANQGAFGWQIDQEFPGVTSSRTQQDVHSGTYSLHLSFAGAVELGRRVVTQRAYVRPTSTYRLHFFYRSSELLSASNPIVIVTDSKNGVELGRSETLNSTQNAWIEATVDFKSTQTPAVNIALLRPSCNSNPCPIFGELSLDDFSLVDR